MDLLPILGWTAGGMVLAVCLVVALMRFGTSLDSEARLRRVVRIASDRVGARWSMFQVTQTVLMSELLCEAPLDETGSRYYARHGLLGYVRPGPTPVGGETFDAATLDLRRLAQVLRETPRPHRVIVVRRDGATHLLVDRAGSRTEMSL